MVYYKMLFTVDIKKTPSMNQPLCNVYLLYRATDLVWHHFFSFFFFFMEEWGVSIRWDTLKGVPSYWVFFSFCTMHLHTKGVQSGGGAGGPGTRARRRADGQRSPPAASHRGPRRRPAAGQHKNFITNVTSLYVLVLRKKQPFSNSFT